MTVSAWIESLRKFDPALEVSVRIDNFESGVEMLATKPVFAVDFGCDDGQYLNIALRDEDEGIEEVEVTSAPANSQTETPEAMHKWPEENEIGATVHIWQNHKDAMTGQSLTEHIQRAMDQYHRLLARHLEFSILSLLRRNPGLTAADLEIVVYKGKSYPQWKGAVAAITRYGSRLPWSVEWNEAQPPCGMKPKQLDETEH